MASRLRLTLVLSAIVLMGCGAPGDVRAKVALFQQRANASEYAEIRREYDQANLMVSISIATCSPEPASGA